MNTNGQILEYTLTVLNKIRATKDEIAKRKEMISALNAGTQRETFICHEDLKIPITHMNRSYAQQVNKHFEMMATFARKGLNQEVEDLQVMLKALLTELDSIKLSGGV